MTVADRREQAAELRRRVHDTCRLGDRVPAVSTEVAYLVVDLIIELEAVIAELEQCEAAQ